MKLRSLIMLAAIAYAIVIGGGMLFYRLFIAYPELESITLNAHKDDFQIIKSTYENERDALIYMNLDWAKWDDTYEFVNNPSSKYVNDNVFSESFKKSRIDVIAIFNKSQKNIFTALKASNEFIETDNLLELTRDIDIDAIFKQDNSYGLIRIQDRIGYFSSHSIQDSQEEKEANGQLIFISYFKQDFRERIKKLTNSTISAELITDLTTSLNLITPPENIIRVQQEYRFILKNHIDKPIAIIKVVYPHDPLPKALDYTTIFSISILLMLPLIITVLVYVLFLRPLTFIFNSIGFMRTTGELSDIKIHTHIYEIDEFTKSFNAFIKQMKRYQNKLKNESNTDGLTGLNNRRYFDKRFDEIWRSCTRSKVSLGIIIMDIDYFKRYNDHYGHQQGDDALKLVAKQLSKHSRRANETLARYGGEEFILIIEGISKDSINEYLDSLIEHIRLLNIEHIQSQISKCLTISCGACLIEKTGPWMKGKKETALKQADENLYQAKADGRNRYTLTALDRPD